MTIINQSVIVAAIAAAAISVPANAMASNIDFEKDIGADIVADLDKSFESEDTNGRINMMIEALASAHQDANGTSLHIKYDGVMMAANSNAHDSVAGGAYWQCYSNCHGVCHGVCHGARGWR